MKHEFPCPGCGASLEFKPGTVSLVCPYCGMVQKIESNETAEIKEHSFDEALQSKKTLPSKDLKEVRCRTCGAATLITEQSSRCPFCDSPVVVEDVDEDVIEPEGVLPFQVNRQQARQSFTDWVKSRWFAPSDLVLRARKDGIDGVYLPFWTYDSETTTDYQGRRGTHYYETETVRNAQGKSEERRVQKTKWKPVSGTVGVGFDDLLVCASETLPRPLVQRLEPWDLEKIHVFQPSYLSGFLAERYNVGLEKGFEEAKLRMVSRIEDAIREDIGGDEQEITSMETRHYNIRFKHLLLPLWLSSFRYKEKIYRFIVNARTGESTGERPYSKAKIGMTIASVILGLILLVWIL
jgi:hypothetical protein